MSTTALYKALIQAGAAEALAEKAVEDLVDTDKFVTKDDLSEFATKVDLAKLESKMAELKVELIKWMVALAGIIIGAMGLMFASAGFFSGQ